MQTITTKKVVYLRYDSLHDLIYKSSGSRQYFMSLPVKMQLELHEHNAYIHTAADLHMRVELIEKHNRAVELSDSLTKRFFG